MKERSEAGPACKSDKAAKQAAGIQTAIALGIALAAMLTGNGSWWVGIACAALLGGAFWTGRYLARLVVRDMRRAEREGQEEAIRLLSQYRHDVMNQMQLVKGYLQLKKFDKLQGPVGKLVADARRHSSLSNLPDPRLAYRLLARDLSVPVLVLQVELSDPEGAWEYCRKRKFSDRLLQLADMGEMLTQRFGLRAEWNLTACERAETVAITLEILGDSVNDTYVDETVGLFAANGWTLSERVRDGQTYILSFESQVN